MASMTIREILNEVTYENGTATSSTSAVSVKAAPGGGKRIVVTALSITNKSSTATEVEILDDTTTMMTISAPANSGAVLPLNPGIPLTANKALQFKTIDSVNNVVCSAIVRTVLVA
jgi:hypothetical protein